MKKIHLIFLLGIALSLNACDNKTETTGYGGKGSVRISTDWTDRSESAPAPSAFTAVLGNYSFDDVKVESAVLDDIDPGTYNLVLYNSAKSITVTDNVATVAKIDGKLTPMPDWFFTWSREVTLRDGEQTEIAAYMQQQIRQVNIRIEFTGGGSGRISSLDGQLSGLADRLNMVTGNESGNGTVELAFDSVDERFVCEVRLLGIGTAGQQLLTLTLVSDTGETEVLQSDVTEKLSQFNSSKIRPLTVNAEIYIPAEGNFTAMISDWDIIEEGDIVAE